MENHPLTGERRTAQDLVLGSFLALFLELAFVRWLPAQVRILGHYPNLILIDASLGLGTVDSVSAGGAYSRFCPRPCC